MLQRPPKIKRAVSRAASAAIDARKVDSRPRVLDELAALVRKRGSITGRQFSIVGSLMSYVTPAAQLPQALMAWLSACRLGDDDMRRYFDSPAWAQVLDRAQRAELGERTGLPPADDPNGPRGSVDLRKDYSIARIHAEFAIGGEEESDLRLMTVISEARRSMLRRRAEGVPSEADKAAARPPTVAERASAAGVSRRTVARWAERERAAAVAAAAAAVRRANGEPDLAAADREPWKTVGVSKATWYRRRQHPGCGETESGTPRDRNHGDRDAAGTGDEVFLDSFLDTVAESATRSLTPLAADFVTAEARRLAVLAGRLGLVWSSIAREREPGGWWSLPPGRTLTEGEATELETAVAAARAAEWRREGHEAAREREAAAVEKAADKRTPAERNAAGDGDDCPARVTPAVWEAVPPALRPRVRRLAGRFFLHGHAPDVAVARGVEAARRENAIVAAVLATHATADLAQVVTLASCHWKRPTAEGAALVLADIAASERHAAEGKEELRRERERQVRRCIAQDYPSASPEERAALIARALEILAQGEDDPYRAAKRAAGG